MTKNEKNLSQRKIKSEINEQFNKISNNRAMDACEIANFLASELFMHQVSNRNDLKLFARRSYYEL